MTDQGRFRRFERWGFALTESRQAYCRYRDYCRKNGKPLIWVGAIERGRSLVGIRVFGGHRFTTEGQNLLASAFRKASRPQYVPSVSPQIISANVAADKLGTLVTELLALAADARLVRDPHLGVDESRERPESVINQSQHCSGDSLHTNWRFSNPTNGVS